MGQTLSYTVTVSNTGTQPLTGVTWRDTTADPDAAWHSLGNLAPGASTTATGSFGPLRADHIPHIILTVRADSDQTDEHVVSQQVEVVAASTESTESTEPTDLRANVNRRPVGTAARIDAYPPAGAVHARAAGGAGAV